MIKRFILGFVGTILLLGAIGIPSIASAGIPLPLSNPYNNQPAPVYVVGSRVLTAQDVAYQTEVVLPRCTKVAKETVPNTLHMVASFGWNQGLGNGAASGANYLVQASVLGVALPISTGAVIAGGAAGGAILGGVGGYNNHSVQVWSVRNGCLAQDATGLHAVPPSEAKAIKEGRQPATSYGRDSSMSNNAQTTTATSTAGTIN